MRSAKRGAGSRTAPDGKMSLVFTGGGTGGHLYPGLAVIQALRTKGFSGRIVWIGSSKDLDRKTVTGEGVEYIAIPTGKLRRSLSLENFADLFRVISGYRTAKRLLDELKPSLLFSKGGYVSVPPCRAAAFLGIPYFTHESDTSPGLATRLNSGKAERILVSWPDTVTMFPARLRQKVLVVGNPVRPGFFAGNAARGRKLLDAPDGLPIVSFLGGSQGSRQVNEIVASILPALAGRAFVFHQTGGGLFDPETHAPRVGSYLAMAYVGEELKDILAASTLAIGRAGAGTVWECAAVGLPMVLIPLAGSGTRGDQVENARMAEAVGAAVCLIGEKAEPESVLSTLLRWLDDGEALARAKKACLSLSMIKTESGGRAPSADCVADFILSRLRLRQGGSL
ncbi:MAG: undecaprenyldiphospho-muramoylpentapeptide beta-N-acetylglucosaminyltransferase [Spirochaetes bacterium]|nr:undecaprenyldiphospho-muramoylpentapeptide beta-N-acetylglucosaminyltransferase [Spirochaetota bacterium]